MKKPLLITGVLIIMVVGTALTTTSRAGYETAPYTVVSKEGAIEIRDYPVLTTVSVSAAADGERDGRFMKLFGYISGKNEKEQKIQMTTPVFMDQTNGKSKMSFVVPAKVAAAGAPASGKTDVVVGKRPAARYAVLRFRGLQRPANEEKALGKLRQWLVTQKIPSVGAPVFAYYDPPWIPGLMRRNEVLLGLPMPVAPPKK